MRSDECVSYIHFVSHCTMCAYVILGTLVASSIAILPILKNFPEHSTLPFVLPPSSHLVEKGLLFSTDIW